KDLNRMHDQGLIQKIHGGARQRTDYSEVSLDVRITENASQKQEIAKKALSLIRDNSIVYIDTGSTPLALSKLLVLKKNLTVITCSLMAAQVTSEMKHDVIFLGGRVLKTGKGVIGPFATQHIDTIPLDIAFLGCDGFLNCSGPTTFDFDMMELKQHVLKMSKTKVLMCDTSKFHHTGTFIYTPFSSFDYLVTTHLLPYERRMVQDVGKIIM
ncbi:MAG: DeoR/GlpR transcriptional regulator, partial [Erysipelotrichaceae bacterium]|nr:DeoR/GlpR transcriptional regulator [Erysipelotrichaceae bacterium]